MDTERLARVGVLLSFLFLAAERGGVQALGVAPAVRLRLLFHQLNMVINELLFMFVAVIVGFIVLGLLLLP